MLGLKRKRCSAFDSEPIAYNLTKCFHDRKVYAKSPEEKMIMQSQVSDMVVCESWQKREVENAET